MSVYRMASAAVIVFPYGGVDYRMDLFGFPSLAKTLFSALLLLHPVFLGIHPAMQTLLRYRCLALFSRTPSLLHRYQADHDTTGEHYCLCLPRLIRPGDSAEDRAASQSIRRFLLEFEKELSKTLRALHAMDPMFAAELLRHFQNRSMEILALNAWKSGAAGPYQPAVDVFAVGSAGSGGTGSGGKESCLVWILRHVVRTVESFAGATDVSSVSHRCLQTLWTALSCTIANARASHGVETALEEADIRSLAVLLLRSWNHTLDCDSADSAQRQVRNPTVDAPVTRGSCSNTMRSRAPRCVSCVFR